MVDGLRKWLIEFLGGSREGPVDPGPKDTEISFLRVQLEREKERGDRLSHLLFDSRHPDGFHGVNISEAKEIEPHVARQFRPITTSRKPWLQMKTELERADARSTREKKDGIPT